MKVVCAWCGTSLGERGETSSPEEPLSHGICARCLDFALENRGMTLEKFLDRLNAPVLLVDENVTARAENTAAREFLGKAHAEIDGLLGGDILECVHARLPGGCGKTLHCAACQIRTSVQRTYATGESLVGVEAYNDVRTPQGVQRLRLRITTQRVKNEVLLRIERGPSDTGPVAASQ